MVLFFLTKTGLTMKLKKESSWNKQVFEIIDSNEIGSELKNEYEAFSNLVYSVKDKLGVTSNSKHNQYRLNIEIEKQIQPT